jgi:hypothetical protein
MKRGALALATALGVALPALTGADATTPGAAVDPAARLPAGSSASEYWDLVAQLEGGVRVTARFVITNEGPGERSAAAFGHVLQPGAAPVPFQNARREGHWRLAPDRRRVEIGSSLLELTDTARHFEVDNDKRGVKVFLDWRADATARSLPASALPTGYAVDLLQLASPVQASIQVAGMTAPRRLAGTLTLTHTWMAVAENERVLRRIDVMSVRTGPALYLLELLGPAGKRFSWWTVSNGEVSRAGSGGRIRIENSTMSASYPIPKALAVEAGDLRGRVTFGPAWLEVDPLAPLPTVLRMLYSMRGRPHRSWAEAGFEVNWVPPEHPKTWFAGDAIATLSFLDALPPSANVP